MSIVHVNLLKDCFKPGKKNYERTKTCLNNLAKFTLLISWEPPQEGICPSSVAKYFADLHYDVKVCMPSMITRNNYSVEVPQLEKQDAYKFMEWLGAFSLQADLTDRCHDGYLTTYQTPKPYLKYGQVKFLQWRGFFTSTQIGRMFEALLNYVKAEHKPWVSLYMQGFSDSPISWRLRENHYYTNGDNSYTVVFNSNSYFACKQMCTQKYYKEK